MNIKTDNLPFSMPKRPHSMIQEWRHLSLLHWKINPVCLAPYIPDGLEIDTYEENAYVSVIPFMMVGVRPRLAFPVPGISTFPEFNIRTYVKHGEKAGVFFITLDAQSRATCLCAPYACGLPYRYAKGRLYVDGSTYSWKSKRVEGAEELLPPHFTWQNVDFVGKKILLHGKGDRKRYIPMNKTLLEILQRRLEAECEVPFKFNRDFVSHKIAKYYGRADIVGANLHSLRKTFGSLLLQNKKADIFTVSRLLGHTSVKTTEKYYVDLLQDNLRDSVNGLDGII